MTPSIAHLSTSVTKPVKIGLATEPTLPLSSGGRFELTPSTPVATIDYGHEVAGYPFYDVEFISGKVQIEVKYSEEFIGLDTNFSDGPFPFASGLSNTYRVETFEVTETGPFEAFLLQGGQRWQSIRLLTSGSVVFSTIGFTASVPDIDATRASSLACIDRGSQGSMWEFDVNGALVRGMKPGLTIQGASFQNYTLEFNTMIKRGGIGWAIGIPIATPLGLQLNLIGELPDNTTFVNTNTTLTPPNSLILSYGYSLVNVTTLPSYRLDVFNTPVIKENTWYTVRTIIDTADNLAVYIDDVEIFNTSLSSYYVGGTPIQTAGTFGFGGWQDQIGYIKNVIVRDTFNQSLLYNNTMLTDTDLVLTEYGVHSNLQTTCLDGAKRDRLVWLGDFYHTSRIIPVTTSRNDHLKGTLNTFLDWQIEDGLLPFAPPIGYNASDAKKTFAFGSGASADLEIYAMTLSLQIKHGQNWQLLADWLIAQLSPDTGLPVFLSAFLGPSQGSAVSCALVQALSQLAEVAMALNDLASATKYQSAATEISNAVNRQLWNSTIGVYSLSAASPGDYSIAAIGFCITSGTANTTQASQSLQALEALKLGPGYKDSTQVNSSDLSTNISPNINGFLLAAIISHNASSKALSLLESLWSPMLSNPKSSTGASWEYVNLEGNPGLGLFTSLAHPWGGAPTYLLTEWAAGLRRADGPSGYGYRNWVINPDVGLAMGLKTANARVVTAFNGSLSVEWTLNEGVVDVNINAPNNTSGVFEMAGVRKSARRWKFIPVRYKYMNL
ncbi:RhaA is able to hydrolyze alpha-1 [Botrytis cinerea]